MWVTARDRRGRPRRKSSARSGRPTPFGIHPPAMTLLDWLVVLAYFALLFAVAWWVIRSGRDTADDYSLAGRNLGWFVVGASIFASNIGSSTSSAWPAGRHRRRRARALRAARLVPAGPAGCWCRSTSGRASTRCRSSSSGAFAGVALGPVAGVAGRLRDHEDRGRHLRRRRRVRHAAAGHAVELGSVVLNSFWIGSVLVVVLTGVYTVLGGMRAVAYTERSRRSSSCSARRC